MRACEDEMQLDTFVGASLGKTIAYSMLVVISVAAN
jgi:hypothetical protein